MADIIVQKTTASILTELNLDTAEFVREQTGETLDLTNADGAALNNEATARYLSQVRGEFNSAAVNLLPGSTSSHLDEMVGLFGVERKTEETDQALWERRADLLQEPSLASAVALRRLVLNFEGVADVGFGKVVRDMGGTMTRIDQAYIVSSQVPETGSLEGVPSDGLRTAVSDALNAEDAIHVGDTFECPGVTATAFGIYAEVQYNAEETPDLAALQMSVTLAARNWVVASRRIGEGVTLFSFYKALAAVAGATDVKGGFYTGAFRSSPQEQLAGVANQFHSCAATVNVVDAIGNGTQGQINLKYTAV